jgi:hypothetical protein
MPANFFNLPTYGRPRVDPMGVAAAFASRPIPTPPEYGVALDAYGRDRAMRNQAGMQGAQIKATAALQGRQLAYDWQKFMAGLESAKEQARAAGDTQTLNNLITLGTVVGTRGAGMVPWGKLWNAIKGPTTTQTIFPDVAPSPGLDPGGSQSFYDYPGTPDMGANLTDYRADYDYGSWDHYF